MSRSPKFSLFRSWTEPSLLQKTNANRLRSLSPPESDQRPTDTKLAMLFTIVALLFVLAEHLGREQEQASPGSVPDSTPFVSLTLRLPERFGNEASSLVRFRLSNKENRSVFYPVNTATGAPNGQLVTRASPASDWITLSNISKPSVPVVQDFTDANLMWIEMPPGGWVDGEFQDTDASPEEHAYVIYVKPARDAKGTRIVSKFYHSVSNY